ncbi:MAG: ABC transporter substrate-binding protein [Dehalococcoidia bacterium]|jgi:ABC-type branched-subunit amino acid transport system substrate-binding protein
MRTAFKRWRLILLAALVAVALPAVACQKGSAVTAIATAGGSGTAANAGVTDTEIKIGTLLPLSQNVGAAWGIAIAEGMKAYYDYINDQGGVYGRKIRLIVEDQQGSPPVAAEAVRKLVEQDNVFAIQGSLGLDTNSAVWKYLEERGIPNMYVLDGDPKWTDPVVRTRFGFLVDYITEGRILGKYIADNYDGRKLGIIAQNDDFGKEEEKGLRTGIDEQGAHMEIAVEYYDETQTDITGQVQRLKAENVDVIALVATPVQAASLFKTTRETLRWNVPVVLTGVDAAEVTATLAGYDNIEGAVTVVFGHQAFETEVPGVARHHEIMAQYAPSITPDNLTLVGQTISEAMVGLLEQAGPNPTRESFLGAAESVCNYLCSTCLTPSSTTPTDHRPAEVEVYVRATVDRSTNPPTFRWQPFGEPFGFESTTECVTPTPPPGSQTQPK